MWLSRCSTRTFERSAFVQPFPPRNFETGSWKESLPSSTSWPITTAVNILSIEPRLSLLSRRIGDAVVAVGDPACRLEDHLAVRARRAVPENASASARRSRKASKLGPRLLGRERRQRGSALRRPRGLDLQPGDPLLRRAVEGEREALPAPGEPIPRDHHHPVPGGRRRRSGARRRSRGRGCRRGGPRARPGGRSSGISRNGPPKASFTRASIRRPVAGVDGVEHLPDALAAPAGGQRGVVGVVGRAPAGRGPV